MELKSSTKRELLTHRVFEDIEELNGYVCEFKEISRQICFKDKKLLDIGCGSGKFLILSNILEKLDKCVGLDPAEGEGSKKGILEIFSRTVNDLGVENIQIVKEDIFDYSPNQKFDVISLNFSLHHIIETSKNLTKDKTAMRKSAELFRKLYRLLEEDGTLFIKEVSKYNLSKYLKLYGKIFNIDNINWQTKHHPYEYIKFLRIARFKEIRVIYAIPYLLSKFGLDKLRFLFSNRLFNFFFSSTYYIIAKRNKF